MKYTIIDQFCDVRRRAVFPSDPVEREKQMRIGTPQGWQWVEGWAPTQECRWTNGQWEPHPERPSLAHVWNGATGNWLDPN